MHGIQASGGLLQDGRFLLVAKIGRGGQADVYRAYDRLEGRLAALKVPHDGRRGGPGHPLAAEFARWRGLRHPAIVHARELRIAGDGPLAGGRPYLVLEYVGGGPLHRALRPGGVGPQELLAVTRQLLEALALLHAGGWVHRDLKPANVLCDSRDPLQVKLTDFGLASPAGRRGAPGNVSGSLPFMAPEVLLGGRVDSRTDLYGLGMLLYHLATGTFPAGPGLEEIVRWHLSSDPADVTRTRPEIPGAIAELIRRLTQRSPAARPADADEALRLAGLPARTPPPRVECSDPAVTGLRLALDAARLGGRRVVALSCGPGQQRLLDEVSGWLAVRGIPGLVLAPESVVRFVEELLLEGGPGLRARARRLRIDRHLPAVWIGDHLLPSVGASDEPGRGCIPRLVARLLRDPARRRPLAVLVRGHRADPRIAALVHELGRLERGLDCGGVRPGGLLVLFSVCVLPGRSCRCVR